MAESVAVTDQHKRERVSLWERLASVNAVKEHRVHAVASDVYVVPGPRVVDAAKAFLEMLHPETR
jgi:ABC-type Fe3+-hydroxamate transport system substrate-binding protein